MYTARSPGTTDAARQSSHSPQTPQPSPPFGMAWTMRPSRSLALCWSQYAQSCRRATQKRHMSAMVGLRFLGSVSERSRKRHMAAMVGLRCEYAYLRAGGRSCAVYSEHRVNTTDGSTVSTVQRNTAEHASLECWLGDVTTYSASRIGRSPAARRRGAEPDPSRARCKGNRGRRTARTLLPCRRCGLRCRRCGL